MEEYEKVEKIKARCLWEKIGNSSQVILIPPTISLGLYPPSLPPSLIHLPHRWIVGLSMGDLISRPALSRADSLVRVQRLGADVPFPN